LGFDGSVTLWTAINPGGGGLNPQNLTGFNGNEWFNGTTATQGNQLYQLGFDGSVTKWTALNPGGGGLNPQNMFAFANALWFDGQTATMGGNCSSWARMAASPSGRLCPEALTRNLSAPSPSLAPTPTPHLHPFSRMQRFCKPIITRTAAPSYTNWEPMAA